MIYIIVLLIAIASIGLSVWSLKKTLNTKEIKEAKESLKKGKVIFKNPEIYSSSD